MSMNFEDIFIQTGCQKPCSFKKYSLSDEKQAISIHLMVKQNMCPLEHQWKYFCSGNIFKIKPRWFCRIFDGFFQRHHHWSWKRDLSPHFTGNEWKQEGSLGEWVSFQHVVHKCIVGKEKELWRNSEICQSKSVLSICTSCIFSFNLASIVSLVSVPTH